MVQLDLAFTKQGDGVAEAAEVGFESFTRLYDDVVQQTEVVHKGKLAGGDARFLEIHNHLEAPLDRLGAVVESGGGVFLERRKNEGTNTGARSLIERRCEEVIAVRGESWDLEGGSERALEVEPLGLFLGEGLHLVIWDLGNRSRGAMEQLEGDFCGHCVLDVRLLSGCGGVGGRVRVVDVSGATNTCVRWSARRVAICRGIGGYRRCAREDDSVSGLGK